ncbi:MAG: hypothetical protein Solivirus2_55 [Solivirus sp.]|uniref:Uncharacterized protein n=1 Tax=Solivirus sp. TaxID=2487772 RepID=A0A3G5AHB7_9VIRU|nr:MAG: hypothetical protein Solivirus2_55 [Solivirus sp.]
MNIHQKIVTKIAETCSEYDLNPTTDQFQRFKNEVLDLLHAEDIATNSRNRGTRCRGVTRAGIRCKRHVHGWCSKHKHQEKLLHLKEEKKEVRSGEWIEPVPFSFLVSEENPVPDKKFENNSRCKFVSKSGFTCGLFAKPDCCFCMIHDLPANKKEEKMCSHSIRDGYTIGICNRATLSDSDFCPEHQVVRKEDDDEEEKISKDDEEDEEEEIMKRERELIETEEDLASFQCKYTIKRGDNTGKFCKRESIGATHLCSWHQKKV